MRNEKWWREDRVGAECGVGDEVEERKDYIEKRS